MSDNWWDTTRLSDLSRDKWEQLCDHCGKCCLLKLEDEDSGDVYYTDIACHLVDENSCKCGDYENRQIVVPDCLRLTPENLEQVQWMPLSCAYRRIMEGRGLPKWHHLVCGDQEEIHCQGMSIRSKFVIESPDLDVEEHIVEWPLATGS